MTEVLLPGKARCHPRDVLRLLVNPEVFEDFLSKEVKALDRLVERARKKKPKREREKEEAERACVGS